jgi:Immunity protein 26
MKKQQESEGSVFEIQIGNNLFAYGIIGKMRIYHYFDVFSPFRLNVKDLKSKHVLFAAWTYRLAITRNRWRIVGKLPLIGELAKVPLFFEQNRFAPEELFVGTDGSDRKIATYEECVGLEHLAIWQPEHIEGRLLDSYYKRPNEWVEHLKLVKPS